MGHGRQRLRFIIMYMTRAQKSNVGVLKSTAQPQYKRSSDSESLPCYSHHLSWISTSSSLPIPLKPAPTPTSRTIATTPLLYILSSKKKNRENGTDATGPTLDETVVAHCASYRSFEVRQFVVCHSEA